MSSQQQPQQQQKQQHGNQQAVPQAPQQPQMFTFEQLQLLQAQLAPQFQLQQQALMLQHQQQQMALQQQQQQTPYMVLTQLPIMATPFANVFQQQQQLATNNANVSNNARTASDNTVEPYRQPSSGSITAQHERSSNSWQADILQPTPIRPGFNTAADPNDTNAILQQLLINAANAQQMLGSKVEPVERQQQQDNSALFSDGWKTMWDDDKEDWVMEGEKLIDNNNCCKRKFELNSSAGASSVDDGSLNGDEQQQEGNPLLMQAVPSAVAEEEEEEDWAPTPLSEIRAKHLRGQQEHQTAERRNGNNNDAAVNQQGQLQRMQAMNHHQVQQQEQTQPSQQKQQQQQVNQLFQQLQSQNAASGTTTDGFCTHQHYGQIQQQHASATAAEQQHSLSEQLRLFQMQIQQQQQQPPPTQPVQPDFNRSAAAAVAQRDDGSSTVSVNTTASTRAEKQHQSALLLPSTIMAPSVMTSVLPSSNQQTKKSSHHKKRVGNNNNKSMKLESPQDVLERILLLRGYIGSADADKAASIRIKSVDSKYDAVPSPLQLASFGTELVRAVHMSDTDKLGRLLRTGLSPNPCNQFRDSIVDLVCKRANAPVFKCLVEHGCDLKFCDGFGRTPMHHCCWASEFNAEIVGHILQTDPQQLFMEDKRGQTPLEYVRADQAASWIHFLESNADLLFPLGGSLPPTVSLKDARLDGQLPDPPNALPVHLAAAISSGRIAPEELEGLSRDALTQNES